jgi:hypothetical protein
METRTFTIEERKYYVQDFEKSSKDIFTYCRDRKFEVYKLKRWIRRYGMTENSDAGITLAEAATLLTLEKEQENNTRVTSEVKEGMLCIKPHTKKKKQAVLIKEKHNPTIPQIISTTNLEKTIRFRNAINECCNTLLGLAYDEKNVNLVKQIQEVL